MSKYDESIVREKGVDELLALYTPLINSTPALLSLLYDADMLPEQTVTYQGAIRTCTVVEAYKAGLEDGKK